MDSRVSDLTAQMEDNLASLEELYTDFDQWLEKVRKFISKRFQEPHRTAPLELNEERLHLHEMLVHGIFLRKTPLRNYDKIVKDFDSYVSNDYVILGFMRSNKYIRSKL